MIARQFVSFVFFFFFDFTRRSSLATIIVVVVVSFSLSLSLASFRKTARKSNSRGRKIGEAKRANETTASNERNDSRSPADRESSSRSRRCATGKSAFFLSFSLFTKIRDGRDRGSSDVDDVAIALATAGREKIYAAVSRYSLHHPNDASRSIIRNVFFANPEDVRPLCRRPFLLLLLLRLRPAIIRRTQRNRYVVSLRFSKIKFDIYTHTRVYMYNIYMYILCKKKNIRGQRGESVPRRGRGGVERRFFRADPFGRSRGGPRPTMI